MPIAAFLMDREPPDSGDQVALDVVQFTCPYEGPSWELVVGDVRLLFRLRRDWPVMRLLSASGCIALMHVREDRPREIVLVCSHLMLRACPDGDEFAEQLGVSLTVAGMPPFDAIDFERWVLLDLAALGA